MHVHVDAQTYASALFEQAAMLLPVAWAVLCLLGVQAPGSAFRQAFIAVASLAYLAVLLPTLVVLQLMGLSTFGAPAFALSYIGGWGLLLVMVFMAEYGLMASQ